MEIVLFIVFGILGGVIGGMGMGGGTLLIPLLTIFLFVPQKVAQGINLIAFLPMAIAALIIHLKNKMVITKGLIWVVIPGIIFSVGFAFIANLLMNEVLRILFGVFLILIAVYESFCLFHDDSKICSKTEYPKKIKTKALTNKKKQNRM